MTKIAFHLHCNIITNISRENILNLYSIAENTIIVNAESLTKHSIMSSKNTIQKRADHLKVCTPEGCKRKSSAFKKCYSKKLLSCNASTAERCLWSKLSTRIISVTYKRNDVERFSKWKAHSITGRKYSTAFKSDNVLVILNNARSSLNKINDII